MIFRFVAAMSLLIGLFLPSVQAQELWSPDRPDGHAPVGVSADHTHADGEWMISYQYDYQLMDGNLAGTTPISAADILAPDEYDFMVAPLRMPIHSHTIEVMHNITDRLTALGKARYLSIGMESEAVGGETFTMESTGLGDSQLSVLAELWQGHRQQIHGEAGFSIPTGSISERDAMPIAGVEEILLPFQMQPGSGTFDLTPSVTYVGQTVNWSWGGQASGVYRLGENELGYRLGHKVESTIWGSRRLSEAFSISTRFHVMARGDVDGQPDAYEEVQEMRLMPGVFGDLHAGEKVSAGLGLNYYLTEGELGGLRVAVEGMSPIYQALDGPQLAADLSVVIGLQYTF